MRDRRLRRAPSPPGPERVDGDPGADAPPRARRPDGASLDDAGRPQRRAAALAARHHRPRPALEPAVPASASRWLAFNGELYNYLEVRERLERDGRRLRTTSDTEVLLDGARRRTAGTRSTAARACGRSRSTTRHRRLLTLCRDRFGEKPLYLLPRRRRGLYFGSEVEVHLRAARAPARRSTAGTCARYLVNGYKSLYKTERDLLRGPGGARSRVALHVGRRRRGAPGALLAPPAAPAGPRDERRGGGGRHARAPDPLGRAAAARRRAARVLHERRRRLDLADLDRQARLRLRRARLHDRQLATSATRSRTMVDHAVAELGVRHTPIPVETDGFLPKLRDLVRHHDAPVYTITYYVHWLLMESIARARLPRLGQRHGGRRAVQRLLRPPPRLPARGPRPSRRCTRRPREAWREHVRAGRAQPVPAGPRLFVEDPGFRDHIYLDADEFAGYLTTGRSTRPSPSERATRATCSANRMLNELFHEAVPVILHEDDLNAMYFSIENRSPFLDRELFEFSLHDPDPPPGARRPREGRAARRDARHRARPRSSTTGARSGSTRRSCAPRRRRPRGAAHAARRLPALRPRPRETGSRSCSTRDWLPNSAEQVPVQLPYREVLPRGVRAVTAASAPRMR